MTRRVVLSLLALACVLPIITQAQERMTRKPVTPSPAIEKPAEPKLSGRLPNYYASAAAVTDEQRQQIYAVQNEYDARIETLLDEIEELRADRDARIAGVLTKDQRQKVDAARQQARERRRQKAEG